MQPRKIFTFTWATRCRRTGQRALHVAFTSQPGSRVLSGTLLLHLQPFRPRLDEQVIGVACRRPHVLQRLLPPSHNQRRRSIFMGTFTLLKAIEFRSFPMTHSLELLSR
jgi:hypothetical protein